MACVGLLVGAAAPAAAEESVLAFATTMAPSQAIAQQVLHPWAARVNEAGKGVLRIDVRDGPAIASGQNFYDRVTNDVVQVAWGVHGGLSIFPLTDVVRIPYLVDDAERGSIALWRLYKSGLMDSEYRDLYVIDLSMFPQTRLHAVRAPRQIDNLEGLRIIVNAKLSGEVVSRLGGTPVTIMLQEAYQALQRHTVEGVVTGFPGVLPYKLQEVTSYHLEAQLGGGAGFVFMTRKKYDSLPEAARKVLDANSGEETSRIHGAFNDAEQARGRAVVAAMEGQTIATPTAAQHEAFRRKLAPIAEEWAQSTPGGVAVLARFRELLAEVKRN
jgi:TRAP-type C4-dicarboxylate transport system substrate-binding protein